MSYDVYVCEIGSLFWRNHTSNTCELMERILGAPIKAFSQEPVTKFACAFRLGMAILGDDPVDAYRELEPANGWGSVESTLDFLEGIAEECERAGLRAYEGGRPVPTLSVCY